VADAFDVMTSPRSYQRPRPHPEARAELARCAGTHFDPLVVRAFLNLSVRKVRTVIGPLAWLARWPIFEWRMARVVRRVAPAATLALVTGVAAITAPVAAGPARADRGSVAPGPGGSGRGAPFDPRSGAEAAAGAPTVGAPAGGGLGGVLDLTIGGGTGGAGDETMGARDPADPNRALDPLDPGGNDGGDDGGDDDPSDGATLTIDPSMGSVEIEDLGPDDTDLPVIELDPAGVVLCDQAGVCDPITVPLPFA
jgi:hypothetical protein